MYKRILHNFTAGLCFAVLIIGLSANSVHAFMKESFCSDVLRFHIIARSDSKEDIELKNTVRDGLIPIINSTFCQCKSFDEALEMSQQSKAELRNQAKRILEQNGCYEDVKVIIGKKQYGEKSYNGVCYPEGTYCSVRIVIGEGKGSNWWCVLFSPLSDIGIERQGTGNEKRLKLKFLEWFN